MMASAFDSKSEGLRGLRVDAGRVCSNCLCMGALQVPIGRDVGTQRDSYRLTVSLCLPCAGYLINSNFEMVHESYRATRTMTR